MDTKQFKKSTFKFLRSLPIMLYATTLFFKKLELALEQISNNMYALILLILIVMSFFITTLLSCSAVLFLYLINHAWSWIAAGSFIAACHFILLIILFYRLNRKRLLESLLT